MTPTSPKHTLGSLDIGSPILRKALIFSLTDGILCSVMVALAETFSVAAAVRLHAPAMTIALLGTTPLLIGSIGQFFLPLFLKKEKTRKHYVVSSVRVQASFLALAGITGFLPAPFNAWAYVFAFIIYGSSGNLFAGIWTSWIRDCIPTHIRGRHLAWRNRFFSLTQLTCAITAGIISRKYSSGNSPWIFFTVIFFIGSIFRFGSSHFMTLQHDPSPHSLPNKAHVFTIKPTKNFILFLASVALLQGATAISGPFFNVWFLRDLQFNYLTFSIASASMILGTIALLPVWGKLIDTIGNSRVFVIAGILCTFVPVPFLFSSSPVSVWIGNFFSGIAWGGFNIVIFNYLICTTEKEKSDQYIALFSASSAISQFLFSLLGGFLSTRLPVIFEYKLQTLFLVSFLARLVVIVVVFRKFRKSEALV